jgi:hypothetical protein
MPGDKKSDATHARKILPLWGGMGLLKNGRLQPFQACIASMPLQNLGCRNRIEAEQCHAACLTK